MTADTKQTNSDALVEALFSTVETADGKEGNVADALFAIARAPTTKARSSFWR